jgi:ABC-2 type transport system ATP-binding protein
MTHAIVCRNLEKTWPGKPPVQAVRGIDLTIETGECFGVLGPNGAGKTTTIEILEGLLTATRGEVQVLGRRWDQADQEIRQRIGVSLQETQLSDRITVRETLRLFRSFYQQGQTIDECLDQVSLASKADSWVKKLSGGQKQRLAVATAIVGDPDLLFLDEPTTGLDPASRRELWDIIRSFRSRGKTIMITTHYMEEAERLCDRVAIFDQGKVIALGTPHELIASLGAEHVIEFTAEKSGSGLPDGGGHGGAVSPTDLPWLARLPTVDHVDEIGEQIRLTVAQPHLVLPELLRGLADAGLQMTSLTTRHASLEDVFVNLTGRQLSESLSPDTR